MVENRLRVPPDSYMRRDLLQAVAGQQLLQRNIGQPNSVPYQRRLRDLFRNGYRTADAMEMAG